MCPWTMGSAGTLRAAVASRGKRGYTHGLPQHCGREPCPKRSYSSFEQHTMPQRHSPRQRAEANTTAAHMACPPIHGSMCGMVYTGVECAW